MYETVSEIIDVLSDWEQHQRVTVEGDGVILVLEPDGHGGLRLVCGENRKNDEGKELQ